MTSSIDWGELIVTAGLSMSAEPSRPGDPEECGTVPSPTAEIVSSTLGATTESSVPSLAALTGAEVEAVTTEEVAEIEEEADREEVAKRARNFMLDDRARELVKQEKNAKTWKPPAPVGLGALILDVPSVPQFHVEGMWPYGGNLSLIGPKKWGKSTTTRHTTECVLKGTPLFGYFPVTAPFKKALVIDLELSAYQQWSYWKDSGLTDEQAVMWPLRGSASTMRFSDPHIRKELTDRMRETGADLLVIDPLGPVLRANGWDENSNNDVGLCLDLLDEMKADAGITAMFIPHHTGRAGDHSRGASVLDDKADAIWTGTLVNSTNPHSGRCIGAIGRDVGFEPRELGWDPVTRTPSLTAGSPTKREATKKSKADEKESFIERRIEKVVETIDACGGFISSNSTLNDELGERLDGTAFRKLKSEMLERGLIEETKTGWKRSATPIPPGDG